VRISRKTKEILVENDQEFYPMPAFPTLSASDLKVSKRFYVEGLGFNHVFTIPGSDGQPVVEHIRFARYADVLLERDPFPIDLDGPARGRGIHLTFSLALAGRNADEFAERARSFGADLEGPIERAWNAREVIVSDPDGYILVFTEPLDVNKMFDEVMTDITQEA
jgi:catechol 2,3-dioxygenase-like lactoylglutathione lyase family enzyme